jgi:Peptidase A4 family
MRLSRMVLSAAIIAALVVSFVAPVVPNFAVPSRAHNSHPIIRDGTYASTNWSGYAVASSVDSVTAASGSWNVPGVTCPSASTSYSSSWVGIDGFNDSTVEQIGTDSDCQTGSAAYYAWYEFYPSPSHVIGDFLVSPGDSISASVTFSAMTFTVSIVDETNGSSYSTSSGVAGAQRSSAEWIVEAPSPSSGEGILPLANFGTEYLGGDYTGVPSTNYATVNGTSASLGSYGASVQSITMVSSSGGAPEAEPSSISSDETSFYVAYTNSSFPTTSTTTTADTSSNATGTPSLTVSSEDTSGTAIAGYYTGLYDSNGDDIATGFTPAAYPGLTDGQTYMIEADSYGLCNFDHWLGSQSTSNPMPILITGEAQITAVYDCGGTDTTTTTTTPAESTSSSQQHTSATVQSVNQNGTAISGYYTVLSSDGSVMSTGFTPTTFSDLIVGQAYSVQVDDFGSCSFARWADTGNTSTTRDFTAGGVESFTAVYTCGAVASPVHIIASTPVHPSSSSVRSSAHEDIIPASFFSMGVITIPRVLSSREPQLSKPSKDNIRIRA